MLEKPEKLFRSRAQRAAAEEAPKEEKKEAPAAEKAPAKVLSDASGIPATPYAKKLAKDNGIDLKEVVPTGRHGEIRAIDVFTAIELHRLQHRLLRQWQQISA